MIKNKTAILGHCCVVSGCYLVTWGIYLLPKSSPTFIGILTRPLFWGLIAILGGICANVHSYCHCIQQCKVPSNKSDLY